jgi:FtsH-binding integral membrane protein
MEAIGLFIIVVVVIAIVGGSLESVAIVFAISITMFGVTSLIIKWTGFDPSIIGCIGFAIWVYFIYRIRNADKTNQK